MNSLKTLKKLFSSLKTSSRRVVKSVRSLLHLHQKNMNNSKTGPAHSLPIPEDVLQLLPMNNNEPYRMTEIGDKIYDIRIREKNWEIKMNLIKLEENFDLEDEKYYTCYERMRSRQIYGMILYQTPQISKLEEKLYYRIPMKIFLNLSWILEQVKNIRTTHYPIDFVDYRHYLALK